MTNDVDGEDYSKFIDTIKNLINVFKKRLQLNLDEYKILIAKRQNQLLLSPIEEQGLITLYNILHSYDLIDEINPHLLTSSLSEKLDRVLENIKKLAEE